MTGFENTMRMIQAQERINTDTSLSYFRTHPMSADRIKALERFLVNAAPTKDDIRFDLIKAKLIGFLYPPNRTFTLYQNQNTIDANYAKAIALYRSHKLPESLSLIDELITQKTDYPYFYELKAQFLLESGQATLAVPYYEKAVKMLPNAVLIRLSLAQALLQNPTKINAQKAIPHLQYVSSKNDNIPFTWQLLATAYEANGQQDLIPYAMAELYRTQRDISSAKRMAEKALKNLKKGTPMYQRTQDILNMPEKEERYY